MVVLSIEQEIADIAESNALELVNHQRIHGQNQPGIIVPDGAKRAKLSVPCGGGFQQIDHLNVHRFACAAGDEIDFQITVFSDPDVKPAPQQFKINDVFKKLTHIRTPIGHPTRGIPVLFPGSHLLAGRDWTGMTGRTYILVLLMAGCAEPGATDPQPEPWDTADTADTAGPAFEDADGDGANAGWDCDDSDAGVSPLEGDMPGDGIDQNCDGFDGVEGDACENPGLWIDCAPVEEAALTPTCSGVDLAVVDAHVVRGCVYYGAMVVANLGAEDFVGTVRVETWSIRYDGTQEPCTSDHYDIELEAGGHLSVGVPGEADMVEFAATAGGDCNLSNNRFEVVPIYAECE